MATPTRPEPKVGDQVKLLRAPKKRKAYEGMLAQVVKVPRGPYFRVHIAALNNPEDYNSGTSAMEIPWLKSDAQIELVHENDWTVKLGDKLMALIFSFLSVNLRSTTTTTVDQVTANYVCLQDVRV